MKYIRTGSFKRLFSIKRRSFEEETPKGNTFPEEETSINTEPSQKPTWKCFSFEELFYATNGFNSGLINQ